MTGIHLQGHDLLALPEGTLFWPARRALIVADLHLEKSSWFAGRGQMLPPYDSTVTIDSLERIVARLHPAELWVLGDSFHDTAGPARLPEDVTRRLRVMMATLRWVWITGNHDDDSAGSIGGEVMEEAHVDGLILRHRAEPDETGPEISGHFHPKWRVKGRGHWVSRRCFVAGGARLILPAFGSLTGGLDAASAPLRALAGPFGRALVPTGNRLLSFPLA